jgi:hypothetical protein
VETLSKEANNKAIRSHGKIEGERDVTCFRKNVYPTAQMPADPEPTGVHPSATGGTTLEELMRLGGACQSQTVAKWTEEYEKINTALETIFGMSSTDKPSLKQIPYAAWHEVLKEIMRYHPTVLHLGCHSQTHSGIQLFKNSTNI